MLTSTRLVFKTVTFEHTIFALPFAYLGLVLAEGGLPRAAVFGWVTLAMVGLRTAGMLFNRILDARLDGLNPRTAARPLATGQLSRWSACVGVGMSTLIYLLAAVRLNRLCLLLSPIPIVLVVLYPMLKRWTYLCHFGIGLVLAGAPLGGWLAAKGTFAGAPYAVAAAVFFWVAGFDVIYAMQDADSDRSHGLYSMPARLGIKKAMWMAALFHAGMVFSLVLFGVSQEMGIIYNAGLIIIAAFLFREHALVFRHGLGRINEAFFTLNASISILMLVFTFLDLVL